MIMLVACKDSGPSLDDVIAQYIDVRNEQSDIVCMCPGLVINVNDPEQDVFASEEECLAAWDDLSAEHAACMKSVLEGELEAKQSVSLVQCYAAATRDDIDCKAQNIECDYGKNTSCFDATRAAYDECGAAYSEALTESFALCGYP